MSGIFNGIQAIIDSIIGPIKFIGLAIKTLIQSIQVLKATVETIMANIETLPTFISSYIILSVSIMVIMRMIGRSTK